MSTSRISYPVEDIAIHTAENERESAIFLNLIAAFAPAVSSRNNYFKET